MKNKIKIVTLLKSLLVLLFLSQSFAWCQITFLPFDENTDEITSFQEMDSSSFVTGFFDDDDELDSCYAIADSQGLPGLYFEYGNGTSTSIGCASTWTAMVPLEKKEFQFRAYESLGYLSLEVCAKESIASAKSIQGTAPSSALIIKSALKNLKIKYTTDIIYLGFENSSYALFRYTGEWLFVKVID